MPTAPHGIATRQAWHHPEPSLACRATTPPPQLHRTSAALPRAARDHDSTSNGSLQHLCRSCPAAIKNNAPHVSGRAAINERVRAQRHCCVECFAGGGVPQRGACSASHHNIKRFTLHAAHAEHGAAAAVVPHREHGLRQAPAHRMLLRGTADQSRTSVQHGPWKACPVPPRPQSGKHRGTIALKATAATLPHGGVRFHPC